MADLTLSCFAKTLHKPLLCEKNMSDNSNKMIPDSSLPDFQVERFIDPSTGATSVHYLWKGMLIPKVTLTGKIADTISGLTLIQKDLENAKRWVKRALDLTSIEHALMPEGATHIHLQDRTRADEAKAFFVAGLTFYAKAFTEAAGRKVQMQRDSLAVEFRDRQDYYMDFRRNFAAHSGDLKLEYATSYLLLIPQRKGTALQIATTRLQPDAVGAETQEESFLSLIGHAISMVADKYDKACTKLVNAAATRPEVFWRAAAQGGIPVDMDKTVSNIQKTRGKRK
jgi:hypothetical protein